jgi:hypothetical protein
MVVANLLWTRTGNWGRPNMLGSCWWRRPRKFCCYSAPLWCNSFVSLGPSRQQFCYVPRARKLSTDVAMDTVVSYCAVRVQQPGEECCCDGRWITREEGNGRPFASLDHLQPHVKTTQLGSMLCGQHHYVTSQSRRQYCQRGRSWAQCVKHFRPLLNEPWLMCIITTETLGPLGERQLRQPVTTGCQRDETGTWLPRRKGRRNALKRRRLTAEEEWWSKRDMVV